MTLNEIRLYLNALLNTDSFGGDINLKEYNYLLKDESNNFFKEKAEELYSNQRAGALATDLVYSSKIMRPFLKESTVTPTLGVVNLSTGLTSYAYFITARTASAYSGMIRDIPLVTHDSFNNIISNLLASPIKKNPICTIDENSLRIRPTNITSVIINYLRFPATPVFDYYIDANDNVVYLTVGATHTLLTGETGSAGQTVGTLVTSTTVELEYGADFHPEFVSRLVRRLGIPQRDQVILQQGMIEKQEQEAK